MVTIFVVLNEFKFKDSNAWQFLKATFIFVTLSVLKLSTFNVFNFVQLRNIESIFSKEGVSKLFKSNPVKLAQLQNIWLISLTDETLKLLITKLFKDWQE